MPVCKEPPCFLSMQTLIPPIADDTSPVSDSMSMTIKENIHAVVNMPSASHIKAKNKQNPNCRMAKPKGYAKEKWGIYQTEVPPRTTQ